MNARLFQRLSVFLTSSIFLSRPRPDFSTATFDAIRSTTQPRSRSDSSSHVLGLRAVGDGSGDSVLSARYHFLKQRERLRASTAIGGSGAQAVAQQARPLR